MPLSDDDVREILRILDESDLDELEIETDGFRLHVQKGHAASPAPSPGPAAMPGPASSPGPAAGPPPSGPPSSGPPSSGSPPSGSPPPRDENENDSHSQDGLVEIPSPMLGTFYRAESPGTAPFVEAGTPIEPDTIVCIIEVMKMMNSIPAGVSGTVQEICPGNGELVEYGAPLFRVRPR
jgi:acetyl-CoA carboxylase biotin carboxyl carrier protein